MGDTFKLFNLLDKDASGEITLEEIDFDSDRTMECRLLLLHGTTIVRRRCCYINSSKSSNNNNNKCCRCYDYQ